MNSDTINLKIPVNTAAISLTVESDILSQSHSVVLRMDQYIHRSWSIGGATITTE